VPRFKRSAVMRRLACAPKSLVPQDRKLLFNANIEKKALMKDQIHWFGRRPPQHGIAAAWGARAIFNARSINRINLLPDRQSWSDSEPEARPRLKQWINEKGLPWLRAEAKVLSPRASTVLTHDEGDFHIEASPQQSGGYLYIGAWETMRKLAPTKTLSDWKARLTVGTRLRCSFRWYAGTTNEVVTIQRVQTKAVAYDYLNGSRPKSLKPGHLAWMDFPKKDRIRFTSDGFELLKEDGSLMSRYHWL
jgi:hypothetical protein